MQTSARLIHRITGLILFTTFGLAQAAEFTWFRNVDERDGWIEFASTTAASQNRLHVFPQLIGPSGIDPRARTESRADGVVVSFVLRNSVPASGRDFVRAVIKAVSGAPDGKSVDYQVDAPAIDHAEIRLIRDGETLGRKVFDSRLGGEVGGSIKVTTTDAELQRALLRGDYQIEADITLPQATYSALAISMNDEIASRSKVEALKTIVSSRQSSGGKFFIFDWRRQSARNVVTQTMNQTSSTESSRRNSVISVDADDAMLAKVESLLGFKDMTRDEVAANHRAAAKQAEAAGKFDLAKLHREYADKIDDSTPRVQGELLDKAIAMLGGDQPSLIGFIAKGIQFSDNSSVGTSRFSGLGTAQSTGKFSSDFTELKLTTREVRFVVTAGPFNSMDPMRELSLDEDSATAALLAAVQGDNIARARFALRVGAMPNMPVGNLRETPLMTAAANCNSNLVALLLLADANPFVRNGAGKRASDSAKLAGCPEIATTLDAIAPVKLRLKLATDDRVKLMSFDVEERGATFRGTNNQAAITTAAGAKTLRIPLRARVAIFPADYQSAPMFYDSMQFIGDKWDAGHGNYRIYEIDDVVRLNLDAIADASETRTLKFDPETRMFGLAPTIDDDVDEIDAIERMNDAQHFRVGPMRNQPVLARRVCKQWETSADGSVVEQCAKWE